MKARLAICILALTTAISSAQIPAELTDKCKAAMKKLSFMTGEWKGKGTINMGPAGTHEADIHEWIVPKIDGAILFVEGKGTRKEGGKTVVVHDALGVISFNPFTDKYEFKSWSMGLTSNAWITVLDKGFDWGMDTSQRKTRYQMRINDKGQWHEVGEYSMDGQKWTKFFEMTLDRVK